VSKPLVNALATAAAPDLRAWVRLNADEVENVVDDALAVPENVALAEEVDFSIPTPLSFGAVADLAEDGLTDEQRKRALSWLDKRAHYAEGAFDAEEAHNALSLLPGWSSEIVPSGYALFYPDPESYSYSNTGKERHFWVDANEAARYTVLPRGKKGKDMPPGLYAEKVEPVAPIFLTDKVMRRGRDSGLVSVTLDVFVAAVQTADGPIELTQNWHFVPYTGTTLYLVVKPVLVTTSGKVSLRVTNPKGETVEVSGGKSAWKALYGERNWKYGQGYVSSVGGLGLGEAASAVVDALTRKVAAHEAFAKANKGGWGGALCPVCFQRAAVTPVSNHMVDHRHQRPGWGYNVSPCEGRGYAPYMESPAGTQARLEDLRRAFDAHATSLRDVLAHPEKQVYTVKVYVKDEFGSLVYDKVSSKGRWGQNTIEQVPRKKESVVRHGHSLFHDLYEKDVKARRAYIRAIADSIPFFVGAVRAWREGLDDTSPILAATRKSDAPALPRDLFPNG
jgi:hypothetical protein